MKTKNIYKIAGLMLSCLMCLGFESCKNEGKELEDEWTATYVYLQRLDYLTPSPKTFNLSHHSNGVEGSISMPFVAKTQKPATQDIMVHIAIESKNENLSLSVINKKGEEITNNILVIKAGQTSSDTLTIVATNFKKLESIEDKISIPFQVNVSSIETIQKNTLVSNVTDLKQLTAVVNKASLQTLFIGEIKDVYEIDRTQWKVTLDEGVENNPNNLFDNNFGTDVAKSNSGFGFVIDLGTSTTICALYTASWNYLQSWYAPQEIELLVSNDAITWRSLGTLATGTGLQSILISSKPKVRYLRYVITKMPSTNRVSLTELFLYTPKK